MKKNPFKMMLLSAALCYPFTGLAGNVEVLHWWTSAGELSAVQELRQQIENSGHHWQDFAIKGGGGKSALTVLRSRAVSANPPAAAQIKGHNIQEWAELGFLISLDKIAEQEKWDQQLPAFVQKRMKYSGHYVAVPINIHRVNWLWINPSVFKKANIAIPTTLSEFIQALALFDQAGILPFAHASEPWVDSILFESIALAVLGPDDYRQAFVKLDPKILTSAKMHQAFEQLRKISQYIDDNASGRTWDQATAMMMNGSAAMQIMGDWAKGDLTHAGKRSGKDFICLPFPGTANSFSYNIDSFAFFKLKNANQKDLNAQNAFASAILDPKLQEAFNRKKGALPITNNVAIDRFDSCSKRAYQDLQSAMKNDTLVPTFAQAMATTTYVQSAIASVVNNFIHDQRVTSTTAVQQLANAIKAAQ